MAKGSIGDAIAATLGDVSTVDTSVRGIPYEQLRPNAKNFYPAPDFEALQDLAESIAANGLLEPLTVIKNGVMPEYRIISGHSRWRAMNLPAVRKARPELLDAVPCVVLDIAPSYEQEMCLIIEANRQRVKGAALLAQEAEKLTEMYVARKNKGEELPGRIRDRVAAALQVSASKLAMAGATRKNLTLPGFKAQWEDGKISDTVAYEISKMGGDHQYRLLDWLCNNHREAGDLTVKEVAALEQQFSNRARKWDMPKEKEDALFLDAAASVLMQHLHVPEWDLIQSRAEAIAAFKHFNLGCYGSCSEWQIACAPGFVVVRNGADAPKIQRSWAETYDAMCLAALRMQMEAR